MVKRLQIALTDDAWSAVELLTTSANSNFKNGRVTFSDAINEMILCAKVDIPTFQSKHLNIRKSLRVMAAQEEIDVDALIKTLSEYKAKSAKKTKPPAPKSEV